MQNVGAIILAAGGSSRFGQPKQLLAFRGESLVRRAVRAAAEAGCGRIAVVAGEERDLIETELRETPAFVIHNPQWERGLGTSIGAGLQHLLNVQPKVDAVVLLTCDQPFVEARTISALMTMRDDSDKPIVASRYANALGVPALFDRSCFAALSALPDDSGAKALIESRGAAVAEIAFEQGAIDIDTPADFERL
ncbi:MAG TPA: nucleotidyltransferase family protein [Chthoniobacterales bacterium]|nr:nucleotidyltransferase family protein [Chthoniobacterales bacterium]